MSAISGIFRIDGKDVDPKLIKNMNNILSHRGPDGSGVWLDGPVALGHQMLHTTYESFMETLPFKDETNGMVITADARIDNRNELSLLLNLKNSYDVPDSLFILKAYQKWGEACPQKLLGDFAFAIWDPMNECLFCARDHMGVKSFYYYLSDDVFYFATEMKALFALPNVPYNLNELKIAYYLTRKLVEKSTFFKDISSLTAAHSIKININGCKLKNYWRLDSELNIEMDSDEDYARAFGEIFTEAVKCRMRSAFPVGFELSGGLDSSSIVCTAKNILKNGDYNSLPIKTFSYLDENDPNNNAYYYIKKVVDTGGIKPTFINGNNISPLEEMENILWHQEQPFYSPNIAIFWNLYKKANKNKIRILLNGEGGDHIGFIGTNYLKELFTTLKWKKLIVEINGFSQRINKSFLEIFLKRVLFPSAPDFLKNRFNQRFQKGMPMCILNNDFVEKIDFKESLKHYESLIGESNTARKGHRFQLMNYSEQSLHEMIDKNCAAFSIEPRYPFRDKRIVEFSYAIPNEIKFKFGWSRYLHRLAMNNIIPKEIQWCSLKFPSTLYERNLLLFEKKYLNEMVYTHNKVMDYYLDSDIVKKIYNGFKAKNTSNYSIYIWLALITYFWLQKYPFLDTD